MLLSERHANASQLLTAIEADQELKNALLSGTVDDQKLQQAIQYVVERYSCSEGDAEEGLSHLLRQQVQLSEGRQALARKGQAQPAKQIVIPPTGDDPLGKKVPVQKVTTPQGQQKLTINAQPTDTPESKVDTVTKPIVENESRQQKIIDSIKACKVGINELAKDMYQLDMTEEHLGEVMNKVIEAISHAMADQTAQTVKTMASPLLGTN